MDYPKPTQDCDRLEYDLEEYGYCLVEKALKVGEVEALRTRLADVAHREVDEGTAWIDTGGANQRVFNLLNKGQVFVDLAQHPVVLKWMSHLLCTPEQRTVVRGQELGTSFLLSSLIANIAGPGNPSAPLGLHADQLPIPEPWTYPMVGNVMWMLDHFTEEIGATRVVPGSHKLGRNPKTPARESDTIPAEAPAGTAMVFDGRLHHATGINRTRDRRRYGILEYCCRPFIRQQQNHFLTIDPNVLERATPVLRQLLGYEPYAGLGAIGDLPEEYRDPGNGPLWRKEAERIDHE